MTDSLFVKMATTGIGFRWLDLLEKEFDKACVELDTSLAELETEEPELVFGSRQKIATLSSCFAQLTHKALTIFQNSAKLEAELVDLRAELVKARAAYPGQEGGDLFGEALARAEAAQLARENAALRETVLALHSELFGARLATKYLDKELAGRIQQLQLLGRDMRADLRDSLWAQVEAEILLQRHKTLVRVCRGAAARAPRPAPPRDARARPRNVRVRRSSHLGLGISVTGGREHGVPILISELEAGGPAALAGGLYVGDAILAINDLDLTQACHKEAVQALQSVKGDCELCVQFIATDDDERLSEDNYRFLLYPEDGEAEAEGGRAGSGGGAGATPTAPRTPDYDHRSLSPAGSNCVFEAGSPLPGAAYPAPPADHAILDMDDDCIKISAPAPLPPAPAPPAPPAAAAAAVAEVLSEALAGVESALAARAPRAPPRYRSLPAASSSNDSPLSTPVHGRRPNIKKKRKPDWRSKGAYRAVEDNSSDDTRPDELKVNGVGRHSYRSQGSQTSELTPVAELISVLTEARLAPAPAPAPAPASAPVPAPVPPLPPPQQVKPESKVNSTPQVKTNGLDSRLLKNKFRIGTAKRVSEAPVITNGVNSIKSDSIASSIITNAVKTIETVKTGSKNAVEAKPVGLTSVVGAGESSLLPKDYINVGVRGGGGAGARLLAGDGDPDFGTPV